VKLAVGYQLAEDGEESFAAIVSDFRDHVAEVYFPWLDMPTGRAPLTCRRGCVDWTGQRRLEQDLAAFRDMGIQLNLLLNANCYGRLAASQFLANMVGSVLEHLEQVAGGVDAVITASLAIARTIQRHFPKVDVRASVNMRIGTVKGMEYVAGLFDSYTVQREHNRDLARLRELKAWADAHGKGLRFLANSGCLNFCSGQVFHDNMVAHELEIDETQNIPDWVPHVCWNYFQDRAHWVALLQNSWVRPEDLHRYEPLFSVAKLATRMHAHPRKVIQAYAEGQFKGNLLDLFEPGHAPLIAPCIIDNARFPADWFDRATSCDKRCDRCSYCEHVLGQVLVDMGQ